jgi:hypothetical protein
MPFVPGAVRFTAVSEISREQPRLKLLDTEAVLTFRPPPKHEPQGPHDKPNPKLELTAKQCESTLLPLVRTFDGLVHVTDKYWDVRFIGLIAGQDVLLGLKLRAVELMKDLAASKPEARALYEAFALRKRLQLQFSFGERIKPSVFLELDHQLVNGGACASPAPAYG